VTVAGRDGVLATGLPACWRRLDGTRGSRGSAAPSSFTRKEARPGARRTRSPRPRA